MGLFKSIATFFTSENSAGQALERRPARNEPCRCGSGKKYKKCHLEEDEKKLSAGRALSCGRT